MKNQYSGKTALITGASSGIGASFAKLLARSGANLILVARREERLQSLAKDLIAEFGIQTTIIGIDLGTAQAAHQLYEQTQALGLTIDILINNAGMGTHGDFLATEHAQHHQMINLNIIALSDLTYLYARDMAKQGSGQILLVASIAGFLPVPRFATYAATKAYVLTLGESLAKELKGQGITVTTLCPGGTLTEFMDVSGQKIDGIRNLAMMSSDSVAKSGLNALSRRQQVIIPGWLYKIGIFSLRLLPRPIQGIFGQMATD
ncbi:MAG: SDR family oxidoreductase [Pseudomonadales bacterium]|nr:SDR family oxidoreductase [Pseudomonadales bacterium]